MPCVELQSNSFPHSDLFLSVTTQFTTAQNCMFEPGNKYDQMKEVFNNYSFLMANSQLSAFLSFVTEGPWFLWNTADSKGALCNEVLLITVHHFKGTSKHFMTVINTWQCFLKELWHVLLSVKWLLQEDSIWYLDLGSCSPGGYVFSVPVSYNQAYVMLSLSFHTISYLNCIFQSATENMLKHYFQTCRWKEQMCGKSKRAAFSIIQKLPLCSGLR